MQRLVLVVVGWEGLATVEQHGMRSATHHAPLSALLLSAVHLVALYTHTQSSSRPASQGQHRALRPRDATQFGPLDARMSRCRVGSVAVVSPGMFTRRGLAALARVVVPGARPTQGVRHATRCVHALDAFMLGARSAWRYACAGRERERERVADDLHPVSGWRASGPRPRVC